MSTRAEKRRKVREIVKQSSRKNSRKSIYIFGLLLVVAVVIVTSLFAYEWFSSRSYASAKEGFLKVVERHPRKNIQEDLLSLLATQQILFNTELPVPLRFALMNREFIEEQNIVGDRQLVPVLFIGKEAFRDRLLPELVLQGLIVREYVRYEQWRDNEYSEKLYLFEGFDIAGDSDLRMYFQGYMKAFQSECEFYAEFDVKEVPRMCNLLSRNDQVGLRLAVANILAAYNFNQKIDELEKIALEEEWEN